MRDGQYEQDLRNAQRYFSLKEGDDSLTFVSGEVSNWEDRGTEGKDLQQSTAGDRPNFDADDANGYPTMKDGGGTGWKNLESLSNTDWRFLGDQTTDFTLVYVFKYAGQGINYPVLLGHQSRGAANGLILYDNFSWESGNLPFTYIAGGSSRWYLSLASGSAAVGDIVTIILRYSSTTGRYYLTSLTSSLPKLHTTSVAEYGTPFTSTTYPFTAFIARPDKELKINPIELAIWKEFKSDEWAKNVVYHLMNKYGRIASYWYDTMDADINLTTRGKDNAFAFSSGNLVSSWNDRGSGGADATQGTSGNQPTFDQWASDVNGKPAIVKGSSNTHKALFIPEADMLFVTNKTTDYTIVAVFEATEFPESATHANRAAITSDTIGSIYATAGWDLLMNTGPTGLGNGRLIWRILNSGQQAGIVTPHGDLVTGDLVVVVLRCNLTTGKLHMDYRTTSASKNALSTNIHTTAITNHDSGTRLGMYHYTGGETKWTEFQVWKEFKSDEWTDKAVNDLFNYYS